jgi:hypothetical protein
MICVRGGGGDEWDEQLCYPPHRVATYMAGQRPSQKIISIGNKEKVRVNAAEGFCSKLFFTTEQFRG